MFILWCIILSMSNEPVSYQAGYMSYDWLNKTVILRDSAQVVYQDIILSGDTIYYYPEREVIEVRGNMKLVQGGEELFGDELIFNLSTSYGIVDRGKTHIPEGYFTGEQVYQLNDKLWLVSNGTFTTCEQDDYHFWGSRMVIEHDNMLIAEPVILYIGNVPVAALPWWFYPIKKGRHSGFLFPQFGNSSTEGRYVKKLAYYWVINDYADITYYLDIMEKKGIRFNGEGIYLIKPYLSGSISGSYIREIDTGIERWRIEGNHRHQISPTLNLFGQADWQSDRRYRLDYQEDILVDLNKQTSSFLSLSKRWNSFVLQILLLRQENLLNNTVTAKIPELSYSIPSRKFFNRGFLSSAYYSFSGNFYINSFYDSVNNYKTYYTSNNFSLQNPVSLGGILILTPSWSGNFSIYHTDTSSSWYHQRDWNFSISALTHLYGMSQWGIWKITRFRHVITPSIAYRYSPPTRAGVIGDTVFNYNLGDETSELNLNLNQAIQVKWRSGEEERKFELFSLNTTTNYYFHNPSKPWSNVNFYFDFKPVNNVNFSANLVYDPYSWDRISSSYQLNSNFSYKLDNLFSGQPQLYILYTDNQEHYMRANLSYSYTKNQNFKNQQIWGSISLDPTDNWTLTYSARWDLEKRCMVNQSLSLYRDMHCWEAFFSWQKFGTRWTYSFTIRIKDIHDIRIKRDMINLFVPRI